MKKTIGVLLLAALLFLTACGQTETVAQVTVTALPVKETETVEATPEPAEVTPEPPTEPDGEFFTRVREDFAGELEARNDYGAIYPYAGKEIRTESDGQSYLTGYYFGLFDENGRIAVDPVYTDVSMLSYFNAESRYYEQIPVWRLQTGGELARQTSEDELLTIIPETKYGAATVDGSFATECAYDDVYASGPNSFVCVNLQADGDSCSFTVYDTQGRELFSNMDDPFFDGATAMTGFNIMESGDGWIVELRDGYFYLDRELKTVAGPYSYLSPIVSGYAITLDAEGKFHLVDAAFKEVQLDFDADSMNFIQNGYLLVEDDVLTAVMDLKDLSFVFSAQGDEVWATPYGFYTVVNGESEINYSFYDRNGNLLDGVNDGNHVPVEGTPVVYTMDESGANLINLETGETMFLEGVNAVEPFYTASYQVQLPFFQASRWSADFDSNSAAILNTSLETVAEAENVYLMQLDDSAERTAYLAAERFEDGVFLLYAANADGTLTECGEIDGLVQICGGMTFTVDGEWFTACRDGELIARIPVN